nr:hypothetical protein [Tanacetum cinerariifolium]
MGTNRKEQLLFGCGKSQSNPIYKITVDILKHTNFFRAFTASSTIPSIYIQQFWDTVRYDKSDGCYMYQLDDQWFDLTKDTLRDALQITPINDNQAFTCPPSSDALINFVNELGYPKLVRNLSNVEYLVKVAKHQRYMAGETESDSDSLAPKPTKTTKKPKPTAPKADPRPPGKKRKKTTEISDKPSKAKKSRQGFVSKKRKPISTLRSMDESVAEDVPKKEPRADDEEADMQRALVESLKSMYDVPRALLPPVVIREPEFGKYQPLLEVPGKGKEKAHLHTIGSYRHDESSSLYAELGLTDSEEESEKDVPGADARSQGEGQAGPDPGAQAEGQAGQDPGAQDEGQARSNPDGQPKGQAGPDPGNAEASQPMPSPVVHDGSDREHMDLDVADVSAQPPPEQMDKGFTATAYLKVQENLKLTVEEQVLLEEPASSSGTLSFLQHLTKYLSFGDLFFSDKPSEANNEKSTSKTEAESMVSVTIQQDMSLIPLMTTPLIDLTSRPESPKVHQLLKATSTTTTTTTILPPPPQQQQSTTDAMMMKRIGELEHIMANLIQENNKDLPEADMKEIIYQRMWEIDSYKSHEDHMQLYEALEKSMNRDHSEELAKDLVEARKKKKKSRDSPKMPPGSPPHQPPLPPPPAGPSRASRSPRASGSSQVPPPPPSTNQENWWKPLEEERHTTPELAWSIPSSDVPVLTNNWASTVASNYSPPPEDSLLTQIGDIAMFMDWFCKRRGITKLKPQDLEGTAFEIIKVFHPDVIHLQYQMEECHKLLTDSVDDSILRHNVSKPLPLGGPPGQMKAAYYPDVGLEQMVLDQMYDYMKNIVLCRVDLNEHVIAERYFKYLYPSDFEDMYLLNLQGFEYKHDYTIIDSPRAITFRDRYGVQMIMRFNNIHKFSDGTLQHIDEALDYRVKEFRINRMSPGLNTRF